MRNTRADVVATALRVLDEHGLENCSMRRVAAELQVQPSALYHHVRDKQSLLALMADEIVEQVEGEDPAAYCHSLRRALLAVRDGADVVATAAAFRLGASAVEARLAELAGTDGASTLMLYTFGQAQTTQTQLQAQAVGLLSPLQGAGGAAGGADPRRTLEDELERSFDRGVTLILEGVKRLGTRSM